MLSTEIIGSARCPFHVHKRVHFSPFYNNFRGSSFLNRSSPAIRETFFISCPIISYRTPARRVVARNRSGMAVALAYPDSGGMIDRIILST